MKIFLIKTICTGCPKSAFIRESATKILKKSRSFSFAAAEDFLVKEKTYQGGGWWIQVKQY